MAVAVRPSASPETGCGRLFYASTGVAAKKAWLAEAGGRLSGNCSTCGWQKKVRLLLRTMASACELPHDTCGLDDALLGQDELAQPGGLQPVRQPVMVDLDRFLAPQDVAAVEHPGLRALQGRAAAASERGTVGLMAGWDGDIWTLFISWLMRPCAFESRANRHVIESHSHRRRRSTLHLVDEPVNFWAR
ncbi:MAG: hypothetical protein JWP47_1579 [Polaromonas sp.]|jgi:hypothetical protein|nr:hypothetical protein [Polaromonas sp.]